jgi:hypothetical protein
MFASAGYRTQYLQLFNKCPIGLYKADALPFELQRRMLIHSFPNIGLTENRTRAPGFKVPCTNHYTIRPKNGYIPIPGIEPGSRG